MSQDTLYDLSIVIVSWNVKERLARCLASIYASQGPDLRLEVFVVDNASSDGSAEMVQERFPDVSLLANSQNLGFTAASNQALRRARGRYVLLLNPDTELLSRALEAMMKYMEAHPEVGALGPQLLYPDGSIQSSRRRFPNLATAFLESTLLEQWFPNNFAVRRYRLLDRSDSETQEVDWVVGACITARKEALDQVGLLDEHFFMYSEEVDWCRRLKARGWKMVYFPQAQVIHHEGKSSEQHPASRHIHFQESKIAYFRKHHGPWQAGILRAFLLLSYGFQLAEEGLKWLVGHKRPLRQERLHSYWQVLRSGLRGR